MTMYGHGPPRFNDGGTRKNQTLLVAATAQAGQIFSSARDENLIRTPSS